MLCTYQWFPGRFVGIHGVFPLQRSEPVVEADHQVVSVLQLDELEGLLTSNAHYHRVEQRAGALGLLYRQHLVTTDIRKVLKGGVPSLGSSFSWFLFFPTVGAGEFLLTLAHASGPQLKFRPISSRPGLGRANLKHLCTMFNMMTIQGAPYRRQLRLYVTHLVALNGWRSNQLCPEPQVLTVDYAPFKSKMY